MVKPSAIILHGTCDRTEYFSDTYPSLSNSHWLPWLQKQLLMQGYEAQTPELPEAYQPKYDQWVEAFEMFGLNLTDDSLLVGHSCGGGFLLRWLSENQVRVKRLVLVAPWLDPERNHCVPGFFNFSFDSQLMNRAEIHILASTNDSTDVQDSVALIRDEIPMAHYHEFKNYGHFCFSDMKTQEFPQLRDIVMGEKFK